MGQCGQWLLLVSEENKMAYTANYGGNSFSAVRFKGMVQLNTKLVINRPNRPPESSGTAPPEL